MRNLRALAILAALLALPLFDSSVGADEPPRGTSDLEQEVRQLLRDLGGETRAQRDAAENRLRDLGPQVLPHLPPPELLPTVSVREAVRRLRLELEREQARESVLPSRVSVSGRHSLAEIVSAISRQTGNALDGTGLAADLLEQTAELDFSKRPFWPALDDVAARFQLKYGYEPGMRGLQLLSGLEHTTEPRPVGYSGAFRIEATRAQRFPRSRGEEGRPNAARREELVRVTLSLMPEPRLRALFLQFASADLAARAGDLELKPFSPAADYDLGVANGGGPATFLLDFLVPGTTPTPLLRLKGKLRCTTAAENEPIRFTEIAKVQGPRDVNIARRRGGVTVTLNRVRISRPQGQHELRVRVTISYDSGGPAFETHRTWILHNEVFLEEPRSGQRVPLNGGSETERQGDGTLVIEYAFVGLPDPLPDYSFVYIAPTLIVDVPIEFEIQSVPVTLRN